MNMKWFRNPNTGKDALYPENIQAIFPYLVPVEEDVSAVKAEKKARTRRVKEPAVEFPESDKVDYEGTE